MAKPQFPPGRGYSWAPFEPGHRVSVKHGAFSDAIVSAHAEEVRGALVELAPWVVESDRAAVERYCRAEGRARILHDYCMKVSLDRGVESVPAYLWGEASRAEANAAKFGSDLGLDPAGRARLAKDLGWASHLAGDQLAGLQAEGRRLVEAHEARSAAAAALNGHEDGSQGDSVGPETAS